MAVLCLTAVVWPAVLSAPASAAVVSPAGQTADHLSCDGSTIYTYVVGGPTLTQTSLTGSPERVRPAVVGGGEVFALKTSTVGGATVASTSVTTVPDAPRANGLGVTRNGTGMYLVDQTTTAVNSAVIHAYNAASGVWTAFRGTSGPHDTYVAGAVDPANGFYYYLRFIGGSVTKPGTAVMYGVNTSTNKPVAGVIATFALPYGNIVGEPNGDVVFDTAGNMYVLANAGTTVAIGLVRGPMPTIGSASGVSLTDTMLSRYSATEAYNGIAMDNAGHLYVQSIRRGTNSITKVNPNGGAVLAGPTALAPVAQTNDAVDLGACSFPPTLTLQKNIVGRYTPTDQFHLEITGGGLTSGNTATTTGSATGKQAAMAGPVLAATGTKYTVTETAASGDLRNYHSSYSCVDTARGGAPIASGTGHTFDIRYPSPSTPAQNVVCTFTNTPIQPALTLKKSVAETNLVVGQTLHYSYLIKNTGPVILAPVRVDETVFTGSGTPPTVSCPAGAASLAPGASVTCTATYGVVQADLDRGTVHNTAHAIGTTPAGRAITSAPSSTTVPGTHQPKLSVVKRADPTSVTHAGEVVHYSLVATNTGNETLTNVSVADTSFTGQGTAPMVSCPATPSLAPGASVTCTATYTVVQVDLDDGHSIVNTAVATGRSPSGAPVSSPLATATVQVVEAPELTITKRANPTTVTHAGQVVLYAFLVTNTGNVTLSRGDRGGLVVETVFTGRGTRPVVVCAGTGVIPPGRSVTCNASYTVVQADIDAGSVLNTAVAHGTTMTPTHHGVASPPADASVQATAGPLLSVVKTANPTTVTHAGQVVLYAFLVTNTGNETLSRGDGGDLVVETVFTGRGTRPVVVCAGTGLMPPGTSVTCSASYTVVQADIDAGSVLNTAVAHGRTLANQSVASPPADASVQAAAGPLLSVVKTANPTTVTHAGEVVHYSLVATNTGSETLTNVSVADSSFTGKGAAPVVSCPATPSLAPGASVTCTATYTVVQADIVAGSFTNTAVATGTGPGGAPVPSGPSTATVTVQPGLPVTGPAKLRLIATGGLTLTVLGLALVLAARVRNRRRPA